MSASRFSVVLLALLAASVSVAADPAPAQVNSADSVAKSPLEGLKYRLIGPFRGGRATGVAGVISDPNTYYFGAATGGSGPDFGGSVRGAGIQRGVGAGGASHGQPGVVDIHADHGGEAGHFGSLNGKLADHAATNHHGGDFLDQSIQG